jgi:hypothetical protein
MSDTVVAIEPVLAGGVQHIRANETGWFVEGCNDRDVGRVIGKHGSDSLHNGVGTFDVGLIGMPSRRVDLLARVIEAVLTTRSTVQVNDDLQTMLRCPVDSFLEVGELARDEGLVWTNFKRPVTNGYSDVVETSSGYVGEILLGNPSVPVLLESGLGRLLGLQLPKGVFIDDRVDTGVVKERRSNPGLCVDALNQIPHAQCNG